MKSEGEDKPPSQKASGRQARAMTRAIDMVSEEFIESFSQTGKDDGPEMPAKPSPIREALAARERREAEEAKKIEAKPAFKGFGGLLAGAAKEAPAPAQEEQPAAEPATSPTSSHTNVPGVETTPDGSVIRVKDTVGKKRGLYTSAMQKPSAEQIADAAVKFSRPDSRAQAAPLGSQSAEKAQGQNQPQPAAPQPISPSPFARGGSASFSASTSSTPHAASPYATPEQSSAPPTSSYTHHTDEAEVLHQPLTKSRIEHHRPAPGKSKMTTESSCPIACGFSEMTLQLRRLFNWAKSIFEK